MVNMNQIYIMYDMYMIGDKHKCRFYQTKTKPKQQN